MSRTTLVLATAWLLLGMVGCASLSESERPALVTAQERRGRLERLPQDPLPRAGLDDRCPNHPEEELQTLGNTSRPTRSGPRASGRRSTSSAWAS